MHVLLCMYRDQQGDVKGDALITYLKQPSVALAVQLMDGTPFRPDMKTNMTVSEILPSACGWLQ